MGPLGLEYHLLAPISYPSLQEIGLKKYFPWVQVRLCKLLIFKHFTKPYFFYSPILATFWSLFLDVVAIQATASSSGVWVRTSGSIESSQKISPVLAMSQEVVIKRVYPSARAFTMFALAYPAVGVPNVRT